MDNFALAELLEDIGVSDETSRPSGRETKSQKRQQSRRETADFSAIHHLLDDSSTSTSVDAASPLVQPASTEALSPEEGTDIVQEGAARFKSRDASDLSAAGDEGGETADYTSLFAMMEMGGDGAGGRGASPAAQNTATGKDLDGAAAAAAYRPRAQHFSNEKPGRDGKAPRLVAPPSISAEVSARVCDDVDGGGDDRTGPVSAQPKSPARRPRRSMNMDKADNMAGSGGGSGVSVPGAVRSRHRAASLRVPTLCWNSSNRLSVKYITARALRRCRGEARLVCVCDRYGCEGCCPGKTVAGCDF